MCGALMWRCNENSGADAGDVISLFPMASLGLGLGCAMLHANIQAPPFDLHNRMVYRIDVDWHTSGILSLLTSQTHPSHGHDERPQAATVRFHPYRTHCLTSS